MRPGNRLSDGFDMTALIQTPMAGVSTPALAAAVSNAYHWGPWDWAKVLRNT